MRARLLFLLAHPDDETFGPGGTIARYASEGHEVVLVTATRGEEGMLGDPPVATRETVGEVREAELRAAASVLGISEVVFLGYRDKGLTDAPFDALVGAAVEQIRRVRPHVVVGFGPEGVSRHPDHVAMSRVAEEAFRAAVDPSRYPGHASRGLAPWAVSKLYRFEVLQEVLDAWEAPFAGISREEATTFIETGGGIDRKIAAFACHVTQRRDAERIISRPRFRDVAGTETFVLSAHRLPSVSLPESDLLADISDKKPYIEKK